MKIYYRAYTIHSGTDLWQSVSLAQGPITCTSFIGFIVVV